MLNYIRSGIMQADLVAVIRLVMFEAAVATVFGGAFLQRHDWRKLQASFHTFETSFELAASPVPHLCLPSFRHARKHLLNAFRWAVHGPRPLEAPCVAASWGSMG